MRSVRRLVVGSVALSAALISCGGDDTTSTSTPPPTSTAAEIGTEPSPPTASSSVPGGAPGATASPAPPVDTSLPAIDTSVPAGTTLRVADQYGLFAGVLGFAEMDQDIPYDVEYTTLSPGIVQLQAFRSGDVDLGVMSPLGLVQAAAGEVDVHAVARWRTDFALSALVTAPGVAGIDGWADLEGKRVAFQRDAMGEALVLLGLDSVGLSLDDIDVVDIPQSQVGTLLQGGDADAGVSSEPFVSAYLTANPTASYVLGIETPLAQSSIIVAADDAMDHPATAAAAAEYLTRLDRAFRKLTSDTATFVDLAVAVWHLDPEYVERVIEGAEGVRMQRVPGDLEQPFQRLIELLAERGDVSADLDTATMFDSRFDGLLPA